MRGSGPFYIVKSSSRVQLSGGPARITTRTGSSRMGRMGPESYSQIPMTAASQSRRLGNRRFLREPVMIALQTMRAHKLRSFLMLLGVILSVSTLILVVALINGTNAYIAD